MHVDTAGHHHQAGGIDDPARPHIGIRRRRHDLAAGDPEIADLPIDPIGGVVNGPAGDLEYSPCSSSSHRRPGTRPHPCPARRGPHGRASVRCSDRPGAIGNASRAARGDQRRNRGRNRPARRKVGQQSGRRRSEESDRTPAHPAPDVGRTARRPAACRRSCRTRRRRRTAADGHQARAASTRRHRDRSIPRSGSCPRSFRACFPRRPSPRDRPPSRRIWMSPPFISAPDPVPRVCRLPGSTHRSSRRPGGDRRRHSPGSRRRPCRAPMPMDPAGSPRIRSRPRRDLRRRGTISARGTLLLPWTISRSLDLGERSVPEPVRRRALDAGTAVSAE